MAAKNCMSAIADAEEVSSRIAALCRLVHDSNPAESPDWVALVWAMSREIDAALSEARKSACKAVA